MLLGSERLLATNRLNGLKVGVLANPASVDHGYRHIVDQLAGSDAFELAAIFGPQHGLHVYVSCSTPHHATKFQNS
ncbi:MAG: exo-beta-N-acetylmuramidase NamZ domain-containing protein, partial [Pseudomonadota bacterium]